MSVSPVNRFPGHTGRRLSVGTIGVGSAPGDFEVLRAMTLTAGEYGSVATFAMPQLTSSSLGLVMTSLASSLTETQTEMTVLGGSRQRIVRDVLREKAGADAKYERMFETRTARADWYIIYSPLWFQNCVVQRLQWSSSAKDLVEVQPMLQVAGATGIAYHKALMPGGEGQERMVHRFREVQDAGAGVDFSFVGPAFVAKESRFTDSEDKKPEFHRVFCETQAIAQEYARVFNDRLASISAVTCANHATLPRVHFLECSVYALNDATEGYMGVLVEKMLDGNYTKWNNNGGYVDGQDKAAAKKKLDALEEEQREEAELEKRLAARVVKFDLGPIEESDEDEDSDEEGEDVLGGAPIVADTDILQAFSHFTHFYNSRKHLVCDLQGVLDTSVEPPVFQLTDPVIHNRSKHGRTNKYGRTDKGATGMSKFFCTHQCNALCSMLRMPGEASRARKKNRKEKKKKKK